MIHYVVLKKISNNFDYFNLSDICQCRMLRL